MPEIAVTPPLNRLCLADEKAAGTDGGTFTFGAWRTRDLNTVRNNSIAGASLTANQFTLPAGTYFIIAQAPALNVGLHKAKLYNITAAADVIIGQTARSGVSTVLTPSIVLGVFVITSSTVFEIQHYCNTTNPDDGFGVAYSVGVVEVYTQLIIHKLA